MAEKTIDDLMVELLDTEGLLGDDDGIHFTPEAMDKIHTIAEKCKETAIYKREKERVYKEFGDRRAEDLFIEMIYKVAGAPTKLHSKATTYLMMPAIDMALHDETREVFS